MAAAERREYACAAAPVVTATGSETATETAEIWAWRRGEVAATVLATESASWRSPCEQSTCTGHVARPFAEMGLRVKSKLKERIC